VAYILPFTSQPGQSFNTTGVIDGAPLTLQLTCGFSEMALCWIVSISDRLGNLLLDSLPLLTGANVLGQYAYLAIGSMFVINASGVAMDSPDSTNLGSDFLVIWDDTPAF
jgi:hypothetical protein